MSAKYKKAWAQAIPAVLALLVAYGAMDDEQAQAATVAAGSLVSLIGVIVARNTK